MIEWTDVTWNPVRGCSRVSEGCRNCYAERQAARFSGPGQPFAGFAESSRHPWKPGLSALGRWTGSVELIPSKLDEPLHWRRPRRVFVNSMSDLFHEQLSDEAIAAVFGVMAACPQHTFQVLTKRPERMRRWFKWATGEEANLGDARIIGASAYELGDGSDADYERQCQRLRELCGCVASDLVWPLPNVWLGVSVEDQATADERIPLLLQTPAALRFVSYEPALGPVDLRYVAPWDDFHTDALDTPDQSLRLGWVIVGGESGPSARLCDVAWIRSVVEQCKVARVPVFVKQLGARPLFHPSPGTLGAAPCDGACCRVFDRKGGNPVEWPEDLRVREFPGGGK